LEKIRGSEKGRKRGLASIPFVGENCQVSEHASLLVVEAEELVDSGDRDLAKPSSGGNIVTRTLVDCITEPIGSTEYAILFRIASVCVAIPI